MILSLKNMLRWVWHIIHSWLAAITTGIDRPLCLDRSSTMVAKANDPEMAVGQTIKGSNKTQKEEHPDVVVTQEVEIRDISSDNNLENDITLDIQSMDGKVLGSAVQEEMNGLQVNIDADLPVDNNNLDGENKDSEKSPNVQGEDSSSSTPVNEDNNTGHEPNFIDNILLDDWDAEPNAEVNGTKDDSSNSKENDDVQTEDRSNFINEDDSCDNDGNEDSNELEPVSDIENIWLLELDCRETYRKILAPHYYCLNFRSVKALQRDNVAAVIKKLHNLIPILAFGLKYARNNKWLCLLSENSINFQMAHYDENLYDIIVNTRNQFNYLENESLCSFVLMKAHPCTQCEAITDESSTPSSTVTENTSDSNSFVDMENSLKKVDTSETIPGGERYTNSASTKVAVDACQTNSTQKNYNEPTYDANKTKENNFAHNYRLVIGIPHPLADKKLVDLICDKFLEELNTVISKLVCSEISNANLENEKGTSNVDEENSGCQKSNEGMISNDEASAVNQRETSDLLDQEAETLGTDTDKETDIKTPEKSTNNEDSNNSFHCEATVSLLENGDNNIGETSYDSKLEKEIEQSEDGSPVSQNITDNISLEIKPSIVDERTLLSEKGTNNVISEGEHNEIKNDSPESIEVNSNSDSIIPDMEVAQIETNIDSEEVLENISSNKFSKDEAILNSVPESNDLNKSNSEEVILDSMPESNKFDSEVDKGKENIVSIETQNIIAKKREYVQEQFTLLKDLYTSTKSKNVELAKKVTKNNNENVIDRSSPNVERKFDLSITKNFLNRCKSERVSYISAFSVCLNAAIAKLFLKLGYLEGNNVLKIGHMISQYYNLEDLTDHEWHDHDPEEGGDDDDDDEDDDSENGEYKVCCRKPTTTLTLKPDEWHNRMWERVQIVDKKRQEIQLESKRSFNPLIIPLNMELKSNDERFPIICRPQSELSIASINDVIKKVSYHLDNVESITLQKLSPLAIFFMTHVMSLYISNEGKLCFSFHHQGYFVPHETAHQYADEIVSTLSTASAGS